MDLFKLILSSSKTSFVYYNCDKRLPKLNIILLFSYHLNDYFKLSFHAIYQILFYLAWKGNLSEEENDTTNIFLKCGWDDLLKPPKETTY